MVMAIDYRTAKFRAYFVKLVTKLCHLVCAVLVPGNNLIDWVNDYGNILLDRKSVV